MAFNPGNPSPGRLAAIAAALLVAGSAQAAAQLGDPRGGGDSIAFEVQSIDPQSWLVSARDLASGESFKFRLPPEAFRGQRFTADLGGARAGAKISVQGPPGARLDEAVIQTPLRSGGPFQRSADEPGFERMRPPGPPGRTGGPGSSGRTSLLGRGRSESQEYEVISVDPRTWVVEARAGDGSTVSLEIDPRTFVGYRFEAAVENLRNGQGFELMAANEQPLRDCCVVKSVPRR